MTKEKLPKLTEADIIGLASERSFARGESYYESGAIFEPVRQGLELRAECGGSDYEPYQLSATLDKEGVAHTSCTCPYDWGGICKHLVALLLTYVREPQSFRVIPPLKELLASRTKEELISLIGDMVKREPSLISVIELFATPQKTGQGGALDISAYRRQARRAMRQDSPRAIEKDLQSLTDMADRLAEAGDWLNAGAAYQALLEETAHNYDNFTSQMDENGDIAILIDDMAEGLSACLKNSKADSRTRLSWIEALLGAEMADIRMGGIDLAPSAREAVIKQATNEEWQHVENLVRDQISESSGWARESLIEFLVEGQKARGRKSEATALIREEGTPEQQAYLLIDEGNIAEAIKRLREILPDKPGLATQFADALVKAGAKDEAVKIVQKHSGWQRDEWLADYYRKHGDPQQELEAQQNLFLNSPSVENFKALRAVSRKLGAWDKARASALDKLERGKQFGALIEIALYENDVGRALELLPLVKGGWQDYKSEVARAAEKSHTREALALYREMAEREINGRNRPAYQQAAQYLKRAKALYKLLDAESDWSAYIKSLRAQFANLPALQDELKKARL